MLVSGLSTPQACLSLPQLWRLSLMLGPFFGGRVRASALRVIVHYSLIMVGGHHLFNDCAILRSSRISSLS
jgi:hypothetical protein